MRATPVRSCGASHARLLRSLNMLVPPFCGLRFRQGAARHDGRATALDDLQHSGASAGGYRIEADALVRPSGADTVALTNTSTAAAAAPAPQRRARCD